MNFVLNNLGLVLALASTVAAAVGWAIGRIRRNYGFERDINHLKNDCKTLSANFDSLFTEIERRLDTVEKKVAVNEGINQLLIGQGVNSHHTSQLFRGQLMDEQSGNTKAS